MARILPVIVLSFATLLAAVPGALADDPEVDAGTWSDEDRLRGGVFVTASAADCHADARTIWFDNDGDGLPDTVPPGGPPPDEEVSASCEL